MMHESLVQISESLKVLIQKLQSDVPGDDPFGNAHNNWSFPGLSRIELIEDVQSVIEFIEDHEVDDLGESEARITDYIRRIDHLVSQTVPNLWGNAGQAVPAFQITIEGLRKVLTLALKNDSRADLQKNLRNFKRQLRSIEAELKGIEPRTNSLVTMVERIEQAYEAADRLPADLESLAEAREKINDLVDEAIQDQGRVIDIRKAADEFDKQLSNAAKEANAVLKRCETAYSAATSVGLAAAFSERSNALSRSMWFWIGGLVLALATGSYFGSSQLRTLSEVLKVSDATTSAVVLNFILAVLSIGAPVWFAWLATKQIGQRFRLAEDYAFKASVARAYEGFRRETTRFDKNMEAKLLASALNRLDELPLRLIETQSHGSPWHELASSEVVKEAMKEVPGFAGQVKELARNAIRSMLPSKPK
ncbi:MAG: hypothetical protein F4114_18405 [Rhodospirillaceae bacterium]|nr:hypothetical protein [Rhodospirillaceae bacterium]MYI51042.1 hypothetical protein [Rhodospirillaceae bacterium]